jgi:hypothetical protein
MDQIAKDFKSDIGAAWKKVSQREGGSEYRSVSIDDLSFPAKIHCRLVKTGAEKGHTHSSGSARVPATSRNSPDGAVFGSPQIPQSINQRSTHMVPCNYIPLEADIDTTNLSLDELFDLDVLCTEEGIFINTPSE